MDNDNKEMHRKIDATLNMTISFYTDEQHINKEDYLEEAANEMYKKIVYASTRHDVANNISLIVHPWEVKQDEK